MLFTFFTLTPVFKDSSDCWEDFVPDCGVVNEALTLHLNDSKTVVATESTMFCFMFSCVTSSIALWN